LEERARAVFAPDTLLATQYFDRMGRGKYLTGERRLMCAIIQAAVEEYVKYAMTSHRGHQNIFAEVERWIESEDRSWLYSFETICDHLGLDSGYLRQGLRSWKVRARGATVPMVPDVGEPAERRRASNE
jgi:hypothetical protein